jgi:hypothetical protein
LSQQRYQPVARPPEFKTRDSQYRVSVFDPPRSFVLLMRA